MIGAPDWRTDGRDWPNREASRFVHAAGLFWHVQVAGRGPVALLLHGTGASTHSWRRLMPLLARDFTVVAPDLPGHGFTALPPASRMSLPEMARSVAGLLRTLGVAPALAVGHSAGAAIALRMVADGACTPDAVVSINGALRRLQGASTVIFPAAARLLAATPVTPWIFSLQASGRGMVDRLLAGTGSKVDPVDAAFYARLLGRPGHVTGALRMMSRWDLAELGLDRVRVPVTLLAGAADRMIPPADAPLVAAELAQARVIALPALGHLAHEEDPSLIARLVGQAAVTAAPASRREVA